ncbi:ADP-ribosylglycohydrolase family protein [Glutamicibacter sp.]|uniref:ADP-ribosylglycohydrolase family protein n=1 Tax=Glutamicibacter sp. TaxID=1931995 RepID=UPI002B4AA05A|nr:ADP-ribosylglycohydrolase family protein [Glutamicibacter sp.]HJX78452.1 ADP-ribosylglycohydrolase family protein [Glutamicibacter sp.]
MRDRICGVLTGMAAGDALGAGYEFGSPMPADCPVAMIGGGLGDFAPGEWTDDTSMAIVIARALANSEGLLDTDASDYMVHQWAIWAKDAPDVGTQTRAVLSAAEQTAQVNKRDAPNTEDAVSAATAIHRQTGRSGGNGSLMRTAPIALAYLDRTPEETYQAAVKISKLTHFDDEAAEACALWTLAVRHAVLTAELDIRVGLAFLDPERAVVWERRIQQAEEKHPREFSHNGWVVEAFQGAWSSITVSKVADVGSAERLVASVEAAVRGGVDTDTVAAIAGSLVGAACGLRAIPAQWLEILHGWPGMNAQNLVELSLELVD